MEELAHCHSLLEPGSSGGCLSSGHHCAESAFIHFGERGVSMQSPQEGAPLLSSVQESNVTNLRRGMKGSPPPPHKYF